MKHNIRDGRDKQPATCTRTAASAQSQSDHETCVCLGTRLTRTLTYEAVTIIGQMLVTDRTVAQRAQLGAVRVL